MDGMTDTYIKGGMLQSRHCDGCAHYRPLYESTPKTSPRVCLYILNLKHSRGCLAGAGCPHRITPEDLEKEKSGMEAMRRRRQSSRGGAKNRGRKKEST